MNSTDAVRATVQPSRWIRRFHPNEEAPARVVCLPHAGGSASYYFAVSKMLSRSCDVLSIQYPGRQDRRWEPPTGSVSELADGVEMALSGWLDLPVLLFGHSLGATVAYEVAQRLRDQADIRVLFVSGRRAPSRRRTGELVHQQSRERLLETLRQMDGTSPLLLDDPEMVSAMLPALRADYQAAETYRHPRHPPLDVPIVTLNGRADPEVSSEEIDAWQEHTSLPIDQRWFDGGHFYLNEHVPDLVEIIDAHVRQVV